jgi:hypothetical protein
MTALLQVTIALMITVSFALQILIVGVGEMISFVRISFTANHNRGINLNVVVEVLVQNLFAKGNPVHGMVTLFVNLMLNSLVLTSIVHKNSPVHRITIVVMHLVTIPAQLNLLVTTLIARL